MIKKTSNNARPSWGVKQARRSETVFFEVIPFNFGLCFCTPFRLNPTTICCKTLTIASDKENHGTVLTVPQQR